MRIISEKKLREFWSEYPQAESPLTNWIDVVRSCDWQTFADVRKTYRHADQVGKLTVFNIGGNKFRMVVAIHFDGGRVYIRSILTHSEYDQGKWKDES